MLTSLNSNATDIDQALYLQEETEHSSESSFNQPVESNDALDDDLSDFDWNQVKHEETAADSEELEEREMEDLLGDFLAHMNK